MTIATPPFSTPIVFPDVEPDILAQEDATDAPDATPPAACAEATAAASAVWQRFMDGRLRRHGQGQ